MGFSWGDGGLDEIVLGVMRYGKGASLVIVVVVGDGGRLGRVVVMGMRMNEQECNTR